MRYLLPHLLVYPPLFFGRGEGHAPVHCTLASNSRLLCSAAPTFRSTQSPTHTHIFVLKDTDKFFLARPQHSQHSEVLSEVSKSETEHISRVLQNTHTPHSNTHVQGEQPCHRAGRMPCVTDSHRYLAAPLQANGARQSLLSLASCRCIRELCIGTGRIAIPSIRCASPLALANAASRAAHGLRCVPCLSRPRNPRELVQLPTAMLGTVLR